MIELIMYISMSSIIVILLSNIIIYTFRINNIIFIKNELFENANICINFINTQVNLYDDIEIYCNKENTLDKILLYKNNGIESKHTATFKYIYKDNVLKFGGKGSKDTSKEVTQELAKYISNIEAILDRNKKLLFIKVITDTSINENNIKLNKPIIFQSVIDLKYKTIK